MPVFSAFSPFGMLEFSSEPSHAEAIYDTMIAALGGNFSVEVGTHIEASIYARAMALGELRYLLEHAGAQISAAELDEMLGLKEAEYGLVPAPGDTLAERRAAVAARKLLPRGAGHSAVDAALGTLLGSDYVGTRYTKPSEILNTPTNLGDQPMNLQLPSVRRYLLRLTAGVSVGLGAPQAVGFEAVDPVGAVPLQGDVLTVEPEIDGQTERVTVGGPALEQGTFVATFTKGHEPGCLVTSQPYPYWTGTQRAVLVFLEDAAAIDPETRRRVHELLERVMRGVTTWGIVQGSGGTAGPFVIGQSPIGATPFVACALPPG